MKVKSIVSTLIISGCLLLSVAANADHKQGKHFLLSDRAAAKLSLTDEQRSQISNIVLTHREKIGELKLGDKQRDELKALVQSAQFDEVQATLLIEKMQSKKADIMLEKLKLRHQVWQVLTAEQRDKLASLKGKMKRRKHHSH